MTTDDARDLLSVALESPAKSRPSSDADMIFEVKGQRFIVNVKANARAATVASAADELARAAKLHSAAIPVLIVPEMGAIGVEACRKREVNWLDLRGNAVIETKRVRVRILGRKGARRKAADEYGLNPFSRKASLVVHSLLRDPKRVWSQLELADATDLDQGSVSRIVAELARLRYVDKAKVGRRKSRIHVEKPDILLDAWFERARPARTIKYGLVAARDGYATVRAVAEIMKKNEIEHAFTGLPAAAALAKFGSFRLATAYVGVPLPRAMRDDLRMEDDSRGRNVAIIIDQAALALPGKEVDGISYVDPIKAYVDLKFQPERAPEAREELRRVIETSWQSKRDS